MKRILNLILLGFLIWLIPFVISFFFYDSSGNLNVSYDLFKSIMIVVSSFVGCYVIYRHFKKINSDFIREGWMIGIAWLVINLLLDLFVLVPFAKMTIPGYFSSIGLRYLQIPLMCIMTGAILQFKNLSRQ